MDASLGEEDKDRVHAGQLNRIENPDLPEVGVSLREELREHGLLELIGNDSKNLHACEVRVEELADAGDLVQVNAVLWVLEEEVVPQGLGLAHHNVLHPIQSFRGTEKERCVKKDGAEESGKDEGRGAEWRAPPEPGVDGASGHRLRLTSRSLALSAAPFACGVKSAASIRPRQLVKAIGPS